MGQFLKVLERVRESEIRLADTVEKHHRSMSKVQNRKEMNSRSKKRTTLPDIVLVLSLMAPDGQAKVFVPVPEGCHLIVIASVIWPMLDAVDK
jgi:hypothetical protein